MHALVFALAALVAVLPASHLDTILERGEILVGTTGDYRPFSYRRPDGTLEGFDIDAARRLGAALGVEVRFVVTSWPTLVEGLREGRYDIAMGGITRTLERQTLVSLSDPYFSIGKCPLVRAADRARFADLEAIDRPGVRIGVNPGGTNEAFVRARIENAEIVVIEDNLSIPDAVASGRVDVMLTDNVEAVLVAAQDPRLVAVSPDSPLTHEELSYMLPRDDPAFLDWVNLWLHQMTLNRELERLREKWMTAAAARSGRRDSSAPTEPAFAFANSVARTREKTPGDGRGAAHRGGRVYRTLPAPSSAIRLSYSSTINWARVATPSISDPVR